MYTIKFYTHDYYNTMSSLNSIYIGFVVICFRSHDFNMAENMKLICFAVLCASLYLHVTPFLVTENNVVEEFSISISNTKQNNSKFNSNSVRNFINPKLGVNGNGDRLKDGEVMVLKPGDSAPSFTLWTLSGKIDFPSKLLTNVSIMIHYVDPVNSAFLDCLWNSDEALLPIIQNDTKTHHLFISNTDNAHAIYGAEWMYNRINTLVESIFR